MQGCGQGANSCYGAGPCGGRAGSSQKEVNRWRVEDFRVVMERSFGRSPSHGAARGPVSSARALASVLAT